MWKGPDSYHFLGRLPFLVSSVVDKRIPHIKLHWKLGSSFQEWKSLSDEQFCRMHLFHRCWIFFVYFMGVTHHETLPTFCAQDEKILVSSTKCEDEIPINKASVRDNGILDLWPTALLHPGRDHRAWGGGGTDKNQFPFVFHHGPLE